MNAQQILAALALYLAVGAFSAGIIYGDTSPDGGNVACVVIAWPLVGILWIVIIAGTHIYGAGATVNRKFPKLMNL